VDEFEEMGLAGLPSCRATATEAGSIGIKPSRMAGVPHAHLAKIEPKTHALIQLSEVRMKQMEDYW